MKRIVPVLLTLFVLSSLQAQRNRGPAVPEGVKVTKDIVYQTVNGRELPLDLYVPEGATEPLPLIIWIHGGGWKGGSKNGINR